jgi:hypothetical protein
MGSDVAEAQIDGLDPQRGVAVLRVDRFPT